MNGVEVLNKTIIDYGFTTLWTNIVFYSFIVGVISVIGLFISLKHSKTTWISNALAVLAILCYALVAFAPLICNERCVTYKYVARYETDDQLAELKEKYEIEGIDDDIVIYSEVVTMSKDSYNKVLEENLPSLEGAY